MSLPTTPFFPTHLAPLYGASEAQNLPVISTALTSQLIQRRSRGTTPKRIWKMKFKCEPETLLELQQHWESVNAGRDAFPFVSPVIRNHRDVVAQADSGVDKVHHGLIGSSAASSPTDIGWTELGLDTGLTYATTVGHNLLPDAVARCNDSSIMAVLNCTVADDYRRSLIGKQSLFVDTSGSTVQYVTSTHNNRAAIVASTKYRGSCYLTGSGASVGVSFSWHESDGTVIPTSPPSAEVALDSTWQRVSIVGTSPVIGLSPAFATLRVGTTVGTENINFWTDMWQIERGQDLKSWARPGYGFVIGRSSASTTNLWQSGLGGRIHAVRYVGAAMPVTREQSNVSSISVILEEDLGAY